MFPSFLSRKFDQLIGFCYDPLLQSVEKRYLLPVRKELLSALKGEVLEIGSGTGANFPIYGNDVHLIACEPSLGMYKQAQAKLGSTSIKAKIELIQKGIEDSSWQERIQPNSLDAIVCTLVLCSIPNPQTSLVLFRSWLKPEGRLIVLEHVVSQNKVSKFFQDLITPFWSPIAHGCHLNRPTIDYIKQSGFTPIWEKHSPGFIPFYRGVLKKN